MYQYTRAADDSRMHITRQMMAITDTYRRVLAALFALGVDPFDGSGPVYDIYSGYASGDHDAVVVAGDWNSSRDAPTEWALGHPARVASVLESVGADVVWHDEYVGCSECYRAIRATPNCCGDRPAFSWIDSEPVCAECITGNLEVYIDFYVDNVSNALTFPADLASLGFVQWEPSDPHTYETGWHPGQDDSPADVLAGIRAHYVDAGLDEEDVDVVFSIDATGQFDIHWSAYVRVPDTFSELGDCTPDDSGYCSGGCVTRPHVWSASGARCTRTGCNVAGTGDPCNDGNCHGRD